MEEESANYIVEDIQKEEFQLDNEIVKEVGVHETENSEYVKEIDIGDDSSSSSSEEESKQEERSPEFVEQEKLEEKQEEVSDSFVASLGEPEDLLQAVENPVENSLVPDVPGVESEKIEEKLSQSLDDCNGISSVGAEMVANGTKETELAAAEEKNGESAGVNDLASKEKIDDLLQEAVVVPAVEPSAAESQIPESTAYQVAAVDTSNVGEHHNQPEIPESTGYQPPIISVTQRTLHPTSWRSCCGLFDVLRRSDR